MGKKTRYYEAEWFTGQQSEQKRDCGGASTYMLLGTCTHLDKGRCFSLAISEMFSIACVCVCDK